MKEYRELWRKAFGDTERYMDYYFSRKAMRSEVWEDWVGNQLCSMAFFISYDAIFRGERCRLPYIVGVATDPVHRHEGRMTYVLTQGMKYMRAKGCPLVFLSPANPEIYKPLGFIPVYWRETTILQGTGRLSLQVKEWDSLHDVEKEQAAQFAEGQIQREGFDLHLIHHVAYYDEVNRELQALEGGLLVLYDGEQIAGVANWIREEGCQEVTELICRREAAERVLESLQAWVKDEQLTVDDSTFISHVEGTGIARRKQKYPYLMCYMLDGSTDMGLRCYINDIT